MDDTPMTSWWPWVCFVAFMIAMLALDLGVFHRKKRELSLREALGWSAFWIALALAFNLALWLWAEELGLLAGSSRETLDEGQMALEFLTAYLVEKSLSMDNIFVFLLIFKYFSIPGRYQHTVLFWGILGALVLRLGFIVAGLALMRRIHWMVYIFGAVLLYAGVHLWRGKEKKFDPEKNLVFRLLKSFFPITRDLDGHRFVVRRNGALHATPLLVALIMVETSDVMFAMDSVPAVLAITKNEFIAYTSNVFAILGLRALYFALARILPMFRDLHYGLSFILIFVGLKMIADGFYELPDWMPWVSLGVFGAALGVPIVTSLVRHRRGGGGTTADTSTEAP